MNTPSHWLMTVVGARALRIAPPKWALGLGAVAPDIPLGILSFGGIWFFTNVKGWTMQETFPHLFKNLFYNHPGWIGPHNFLHSPTSLILMVGLAWWICRASKGRTYRVARWFKFFLCSCLFHSIVDVLTHFDDGPLLFFPFNWSWRFSSPVSYWDPEHFGRQFMAFEAILDLILIGILLTMVISSFRSKRKT